MVIGGQQTHENEQTVYYTRLSGAGDAHLDNGVVEAVELDHLRPARRLHVGERGVEHLRLVRKERDPRQVRACMYISGYLDIHVHVYMSC